MLNCGSQRLDYLKFFSVSLALSSVLRRLHERIDSLQSGSPLSLLDLGLAKRLRDRRLTFGGTLSVAGRHQLFRSDMSSDSTDGRHQLFR